MSIIPTWTPSSTIRETWGRLQIFVGGVDVSFFRDTPTKVYSFSSGEPFDDDTAEIGFPQITPFEPLGEGALSWLYDWAPIEIYVVRPDGSVRLLYEGEIPSMEDQAGGDSSWNLRFHCFGVLYLAKNYQRRPIFAIDKADIGTQIAEVLNDAVEHYNLRLRYTANVLTGIDKYRAGSWSNLLTGYIQGMLTAATVSIIPDPSAVTLDIAMRPDLGGYWLVSTDGTVIPYGTQTPYYGSMHNVPENGIPCAIVSTPSGRGYWIASTDGGVFAFGDAGFFGSTGSIHLNQPVVDMKRTPSGNGYWLLGADGGVFNFGDAGLFGSIPGSGITVTDAMAIMPTEAGDGYTILRRDGSTYNYGAGPLVPPVPITYTGQIFVDLERHPGGGYWALDATGNVYAYDGAPYDGGAGGLTLAAPMRRLAPTANGYWLVAEDGGVFTYGSLAFWGSTPGGRGNFNQWTLMKEPGRLPVIRLKDLWTEHWHIRLGTAGVEVDLTRDLTTAPNTFFGEGLDAEGCFPAGTPVSLAGVQRVFRRHWQKGLIHLITASGRHLAATPNHPILTASGWKAARRLVPGDKVIGHPGADRMMTAKPDVIDQPVPIDEVFRAALESSASERVPGVGMDFHGDIAEGEVEVVRAHSKLRDDRQAASFEHVQQSDLVPSGEAAGDLAAYCHACTLLDGVTTAGGEMSLGGHRLPVFGAHAGHGQQDPLAHVSDLDAVLVQDEADRMVRDADRPANADSGLPADIATDDVVFVYFDSTWAGDVYNLQTDKGWYYANDIVVHNCLWRNTKYPGERLGDPPVWTREITIGMGGSDVSTWEQAMSDMGWDVVVDGVYTVVDRSACIALQQQAGLAITGTVTAQTWASTFDVGNEGGDPYFMPLAIDPAIEPYLYNANGTPTGPNPDFDPLKTRVESFDQYGAPVEKVEGIIAARANLNRFNPFGGDGKRHADPGLTGTIKLLTDPVEGCRFEIRAGHNIVLQSYRGRDVFFHIAHADHDMEALQTSLTVDVHARDLMTLDAVMQRDRAPNPTGVALPTMTASSVSEDRMAAWDCENNAGKIPRHAIQPGLWNVLRIPGGTHGLIQGAEFILDVPAEFSVGLFGKRVTHAMLASVMPAGPLAPMSDGSNPWDMFKTNPTASGIDPVTGYIEAWGGVGNPGGYYPYVKGQPGAVLNGKYANYSPITFDSFDPPWLYVAIWTDTTNYFTGRLLPSVATL